MYLKVHSSHFHNLQNEYRHNCMLTYDLVCPGKWITLQIQALETQVLHANHKHRVFGAPFTALCSFACSGSCCRVENVAGRVEGMHPLILVCIDYSV
jgi:hypothetical protein